MLSMILNTENDEHYEHFIDIQYQKRRLDEVVVSKRGSIEEILQLNSYVFVFLKVHTLSQACSQ